MLLMNLDVYLGERGGRRPGRMQLSSMLPASLSCSAGRQGEAAAMSHSKNPAW